ncbi:SDR family NAD(P)-dependent oxidoreductase [Phytohabitans kaempferiae]|uniref:SDR family NAD(P)-dependent oxidoreductase n=1 Tax=Phytohabitans kaempferiae TaxID=1620943 RepID=A0ABV6M3M9_9ACTN
MRASRTAVITGGMSGLGAAAAARLVKDGLKVITLDLADRADLRVDVTDAAAVRAAAARLGPVDILVNAAGVVGPYLPLWQIPLDAWENTFAVNVHGTFNACKAFVPAMRERGWGRIINVASIAGKVGNPNMSAYSAASAALIALTKSLGKELATSGVLANAVAPTLVQAPSNAATAPEAFAHASDRTPTRRLSQPEEIAEFIAWLASDKVNHTTGAIYDIGGAPVTY